MKKSFTLFVFGLVFVASGLYVTTIEVADAARLGEQCIVTASNAGIGTSQASGVCRAVTAGSASPCQANESNSVGSCQYTEVVNGVSTALTCCYPRPAASTCTGAGGVCWPSGTCSSPVPGNPSCYPSSTEVCCQRSAIAATPSANSSFTVTGGDMANYQLLEQIPGSSETVGRLDTYLRDIYIFAFWAVGIAVVFMLTIGGFMYLTSAGNTSRMESAKTVIFDAILGLVLALVAWLFLYVINPDLVNLNLRAVSITPISSTAAPAATTPTPGVPTTPSTGATGCGGLATRGISPSQCGDASPQLSDLLACIQSRYPSAQVNSISDSAGFSQCKNNWTDPVCAHARTSCHYGGGSSKTAPECQRSHGADLSTRNASGGVDGNIAMAIMAAAQACGGRVNNEGAHIHVSTQTSCCTL